MGKRGHGRDFYPAGALIGHSGQVTVSEIVRCATNSERAQAVRDVVAGARGGELVRAAEALGDGLEHLEARAHALAERSAHARPVGGAAVRLEVRGWLVAMTVGQPG